MSNKRVEKGKAPYKHVPKLEIEHFPNEEVWE